MKRSDVALVFYSMKNNRYSINVLVAALEKDDRTPVDVYVVDERRQITLLNTLQRLRSLYKKTVLAISFLTTQLPFIEKLVDMVKKFLPDILVIAGGPHATGEPLGTITRLK
ncbi:MAG TPA: B12-binding domain-containing radical SAM protein, partial [Desulfurococcaceae archaeon]|nr:B12-binding domain-containing radical SAM protein [Desulfurococcaceae archaeon]